MENFVLVLGENSPVLPGHTWTQYDVKVEDEELICVNHKDSSVVIKIPYTDFEKAEFGIGSGNLWLQCKLKGGSLIFCSPRKCWKSEAGKKLIEKINNVTEIIDKKNYDRYTGKFFFFWMFK